MLPKRAERYTIDDIRRTIDEKLIESETLEYKEDPGGKLEAIIAKAVSAFANGGGGDLVLGLAESPTGEPIETDPPGMPALLGKVPVAEQVDRLIRTKVVPNPPAAVEGVPIAGTDRAYVIIAVSPRGGGPYRITNTSDPTLNGRYYVRRGRESVEADHFTLRALFAEAQEEAARVREYLSRHGFVEDPDDSSFAQREPARLLSDDANKRARGAVLVTVIPEVLRGDVFDLDRPEIRSLLKTGGEAGWHEERATLEGRMLYRAGSPPPLLRAYFLVHRNGYIESGDARVYSSTTSGNQLFPHAVAAVLSATLTQAARLYEAIEIRDRLLVGLHLRAVDDTRLAIRGSFPIHTEGYNTQRNLTIDEILEVKALTLPSTRVTFDRRLSNAYGLDHGLVLKDDGSERSWWGL